MTVLADTSTVESPAPLLTGWDSLELWVGNARAAAHWLAAGFGFTPVAYAGPETGVGDRASYVLTQGDIRLVVTAGLTNGHPIGEHVARHGDGVVSLRFAVDDPDSVERAYRLAVERGARPIAPPHSFEDDRGRVTEASVGTYGDCVHTFVDRTAHSGPFGPGYSDEGIFRPTIGEVVGLHHVDHVVGNVEEGRLDDWVRFYERTFGFEEMTHFDRDQISTEYSALRSTVVWNHGKVVMPINEPAVGRKKSQIQEYLDAYGMPGVQHIAMHTDDIVTAVSSLRDRGVRFLTPPPSYYDDARLRLGEHGDDLPWSDLERLGILVDVEAGGILLQVFTETFTDRPTLFFEVIERRGATGFGEGNFKALFEAIEREQARRGNL